MTKGVAVMLVCTTKDSIVTILFSLYTDMAVITSLQTKNYLYNITGKGHGSFAQKRGIFSRLFVYMVDTAFRGITVQLDNHKITMATSHTFPQNQTIRKEGKRIK